MSSPIYLGLKNLDTFWCTGWAWNCQIIFRCASIHGRAGFILNITYRCGPFNRLFDHCPHWFYNYTFAQELFPFKVSKRSAWIMQSSLKIINHILWYVHSFNVVSRWEITVTTECKQAKHRHIAYFQSP
jgi:hypothetical protein